MIRRVNHTKRKRIARSDIAIRLRERGGGAVIAEGALFLAGYGFPPDARVILEAYGRHRMSRVDLGRIGDSGSSFAHELAAFEQADGIHFRIKVVAPSGEVALLLGLAEGVAPEQGDAGVAKSLLPVRPADLEEVAWRLAFEDQAGPVLEINQRLRGWASYVRSSHFNALAHVEVLRQILREALARGGDGSDSEATSWQSRWLSLGAWFAGRYCDSSGEIDQDQEDWVEDACRAFARKMLITSRLNAATEEDHL